MPRSTDLMPEPRQTEDLFVEFANTVSFERGTLVDDVAEPAALLDWLHDKGLISDRGLAAEMQRLDRDPDEAARRLERFRYLRDLLHAIATRASDGGRPSREQVRDLNHVLRHGLHYHKLERDHARARYAVAQVGDRLDQARATIASSLAHYLAEEGPDRLRVCDNRDSCAEVFVDRSPTGRRRWCDMRVCGNQAKVARHRARARESESGVPEGGSAD
jgi:predicted RNA-binding Zn ribbon-like protein